MKIYRIEEKIKFDELDGKILSLLCLNPRKKISEIAKHLGIPKSKVLYRIRRMEKNNLIQGYSILVNWKLLGFRYFFIVIDKIEGEELKKYVSREEKILKAHLGYGDFFLLLEVVSKDEKELKDILKKIKEKGGRIKYLLECLNVLRYFHLNLLDFGCPFPPFSQSHLENVEMPKDAFQLIKELEKNSRERLVNIAPNLSFKRKKKIIDFLIRKRIIVPYVILNTSRLGYRSYFVLLEDYHQALEKLSIICYETLFPYQYLAVFDLKKEEEFRKLLEEIRKETKAEFMMETSEWKYTELPKSF